MQPLRGKGLYMYIRYQGFSPERNFEDNWKKQLELLLEKSPHGASLCCCLSQEEDKFFGSIHMKSLQGEFATCFEHKEIESLAQKLVNRMHEQVTDWHVHRFEGTEAKDPQSYENKWMSKEEVQLLDQLCDGEKCKCPLHA
jgi:hypothetical protein